MSGADDVMPRARIELSPKNALDQLSKLVKISQTTASSFEEKELAAGFKKVIELIFVRMKIGICDQEIPLRKLVREEMPKVVGIVKLVAHLLQKFEYTGKHEKAVLEGLSSPLGWHLKAPPKPEALMVCQHSCKHLHGFLVSLYQGKYDHVFAELMEDTGTRRRDGPAYASHGKFHLATELEQPYQREKVQAENAKKFAAAPAAAPVVEDSQVPSEEDADSKKDASASSQVPPQDPASSQVGMEIDLDDDNNEAAEAQRKASWKLLIRIKTVPASLLPTPPNVLWLSHWPHLSASSH